MFSVKSAVLCLAAVLGTQVHGVAAVCASGQMAVGTSFYQLFTGPSGAFNVYSGFLMANNCGLIDQNGSTQDTNQMCRGGYAGSSSVTCSGGQPVAAVDTKGQKWNCSPTNDSSCNKGSSGGAFTVLACCNRA